MKEYLINKKQYTITVLSVLVILASIAFTNAFQNPFQYSYSQHYQIPILNNSYYSTKNAISNTILEQFKEIVFDQALSRNSSNHNYNTVSNSNTSIPIVVGIVSPNGTQISGYGNVSNLNSTKVDGNTVFDVASISKTFVAIILSDMVNQGIVNLSDPIEKYLPTDNVKVPSFNGNKIALVDLATHTSGLPDFPTGWIRNQTYTTQEVYDFVSNTTLSNTPGTKASYSDIGMGLLGHILSLKAGVSFDQLVKDRILNVLGMDSTGMRINSSGVSVPEDVKSRYATGHIAGKVVNLEFIPETIQSAGAMYSTTNDLLKYLSANIGLLRTNIYDSMQDTHLIRHTFGQSSENKSLKDYVGLGWTVSTDFGKEVIWHTGSIDGYTSIIGFNPGKQIGLVIMCGCNYNDFSTPKMINLVIPFLLYHE